MPIKMPCRRRIRESVSARFPRAGCALALFLAAFCSFLGEPRSAPDRPAAQSTSGLLESGERAFGTKDYRGATAAFSSAFLQSPQPAILCHLGKLAHAQGYLVAARDLFQRCLAGAPEALDPILRQLAQKVVAEPVPPSGSLSILSKQGGFLWMDERLMAKLPADERLSVQVAVGRHTLRIARPGNSSSVSTEVDVKADERLNARCDDKGISVLSPFSVLLILQDEAGRPWQNPDRIREAWQAVDLAISKESGALMPLATLQQLQAQARDQAFCADTPACQIGLGQRARATYVLVIRSQPAPGTSPAPTYRLRSALLDTRTELQSHEDQAECDGCTQEALLSRLAELARRTFLGGLRPVGWLEVRTPKAELTVDGVLRGRAPFRRALFPGPHKVSLFRPYFEPIELEAQVDEGETSVLDLKLIPTPLSRGERAVRAGKWIFGGVGLALTVAGAVLFTQADTYSVPMGQEDFLTQTSTRIPGLSLLVGGGVALGISITLFATDAHYARRRR